MSKKVLEVEGEKIDIEWVERKFLVINKKYAVENFKKAVQVLKRGEEIPNNVTAEIVLKVLRLAEKLVDRTYFALALDEDEGVRAASMYLTMKQMKQRGMPLDGIKMPVAAKPIAKEVQEQFYDKAKIMRCPECNEVLFEGKDVNGRCYHCPSCGSEACNVAGLKQEELGI